MCDVLKLWVMNFSETLKLNYEKLFMKIKKLIWGVGWVGVWLLGSGGFFFFSVGVLWFGRWGLVGASEASEHDDAVVAMRVYSLHTKCSKKIKLRARQIIIYFKIMLVKSL